MAIQVQNIVNLCGAALDAEGYERYTFDNDYVYAINYAKDWVVTAFNKAFAENKLSEENLRELVRVRIWVASKYSRIYIDEDDTGDRLWGIYAIYPKITYMGSIPTLPSDLSSFYSSLYCPDASYVKSYKSAKRGTLEEVNPNRLNPFFAGNEVNPCEETRDYLYSFAVDYNGGYVTDVPHELEIYPSVAYEPVAIAYLSYPSDVDSIIDELPFPEVITNIIVNKALEWISYKQGDNTNLKGVTDQDVSRLVSLMI